MLSAPFAAAIADWAVAVTTMDNSAIDDDRAAKLREEAYEIAGQIQRRIPETDEDRTLQGYLRRHCEDLDVGSLDGANPFWLETDMARYLTPAVRLLVALWGAPFTAERWLRQWRDAAGIAIAVEQPDGTASVLLGHTREARGQELDRPTAEELRAVLCNIATDEPGRAHEIEIAIMGRGPVKPEAWFGSAPAVLKSATRAPRPAKEKQRA